VQFVNAIIVENLNYTYPDGRRGLRDVFLSVEDGSRVALVGSNGSGKSTFLLHLNGLLNGTGLIEIMGVSRSRKNMKLIRKKIGYLFSHIDYQFIMPDLLNDIMISIPGGIDMESKIGEARTWLNKFKLSDYEQYSPLELSSGEMKRAALAGVLARKPDVLILDEPLNAVDRKASMDLIEILSSLHHTMIMATHRQLLVRELATHVAVMENGSIAGYYTVKEGLKRDDVQGLLI